MSKRKKVFLFIGLLLVIAIMIGVTLKKDKTDSIQVSVESVKRGDITRTVSGSGYVQPAVKVDISARIPAEIVEIHVVEGEKVRKGQLLVDLDRTRHEASLEQTESQLLSARAEFKKATADFNRTRDLFKKNLTSQADLDAAEARSMSAESSVRQMEAVLRQAKDDLSKTRLLSPMDGTVIKLYKEKGEIVTGSQFQADPILNVADLGRMEVLTEIDENDVVYVKPGDVSKIEVDAIQDTLLAGVVSEIAHLATTRGRGTQEQVTNFEVKVALTQGHVKLRPGMSATVDIETQTHRDVLYIPIQCVTARATTKEKPQEGEEKAENPGSPNKSEKPEMEEVVFVVEADSVRQVKVETGISDDTHIEIVSGLQEEEQVVSGSYKALSSELRAGSRVKVTKELGYRKSSD
ncbi:efflux RND transporter periplasmic adaptor subunit [candidate division KSB1 bacterium]|nr:efflux RND transporter periplasmic adaptor subunit [candidate division KSB1 bacterium]